MKVSSLDSSVIKVEGLHKTFPGALFKPSLTALKGVSLSVNEGEVYGLIGPNGSGKSTLMKAVLGLSIPTGGACYIFGKNSLYSDARQHIGYLPENPYFYKYLTGYETLVFYGKLSNIPRGELGSRVREVLHRVSLYEVRDRKVRTYSKGMLQRIGIAQAIIHNPKLLVLDEPTAGVDPAGCLEIKKLIRSFKAEGKTVFLCSHLLEQLPTICDRIGMVSEGELKIEGCVSDLLEDAHQKVLVTKGSERGHEELIDLSQGIEELDIISYGKKTRSLEELFLRLTNPPS